MSLTVHCFVSGALIRAARGSVAVEALSPGDEVVVVRGATEALEPVRWVGSAWMDIARHPRPEEAAPVRVRTDAIAEGQPASDLLVSPEHCMFVDGLLVPVKLLVNGGSIVSEREHAPFTYYHIELEKHGLLISNGALTESYLDTGTRDRFDNGDVSRQLHPSFEVNYGSERWLTDACAPLAKVPDDVEPIWRALAARSEALGYPVSTVTGVDDPDFRLVADGLRIAPVSRTASSYVFVVPAGVASVSLSSRFCIPSDWMIPAIRDTRRIGVRVSGISIRTDIHETVIPVDHPCLTHGWNDVERDASSMWRWTDGNALLPWKATDRASFVTIECSAAKVYPAYDEHSRLVA